jgi:hypothetical protein
MTTPAMFYRAKKLATVWSKYSLTKLGSRLGAARVQQVSALSNYVALGHWMRVHGFRFPERLPSREAVFSRVAERLGDDRVLYLEFGVYEGGSMRSWSRKLTHPDSRLHGFDSFDGLPETGGIWHKGQFGVEGRIPRIDDHRVQLFQGWFDQTLPEYQPPPHDRLVINIDADLYSSTICVLRHLRPHIRSGTYIYFDDFCQVDHEPRAFHDFMVESGLRFAPVCASVAMCEVFFVCVG